MDMDTGYRILGESSDGVAQIIIYLVVGAIVLLGNISKGRAQQKRSRHTGDSRPKPRPSGQRSHAQASAPEPQQQQGGAAAEIPPNASPGRNPRVHEYHEPGGFAEALLDEALEETLKKRSRKTLEIHTQKRPIVQPMQDVEVADHNLEGMGRLETLDVMPSPRQDTVDAISSFVSLHDPDDLARAVVYAEVLSKPVGLKGFSV